MHLQHREGIIYSKDKLVNLKGGSEVARVVDNNSGFGLCQELMGSMVTMDWGR